MFDWRLSYFGRYVVLCKGETLPHLLHLERDSFSLCLAYFHFTQCPRHDLTYIYGILKVEYIVAKSRIVVTRGGEQTNRGILVNGYNVVVLLDQ